MSFLATLNIDNEIFNVLDFEFDFKKETDVSNKPIGRPLGGTIKLTLESDKKTDFLDWILNDNETKDGNIVFYRRDAMSKMRALSFTKAYCIGYNEKFSSTTAIPMHINLVISAKEIVFGASEFSNDWIIS